MRSVAVLIAAAAALATAPAAAQAPSAEEIVEKLAPRDEKPLTRSWGTADRGITVEPGDQAAEPPSIDLHIPFAFDSAELGTDAQIILRQLGRALDDPALRDFSFRLVGHTDAKGTAEYNADLSRRRAEAVAEYLKFHYSVAPERLSVEGRGEQDLADPERPHDGINRRVEVINTGRPGAGG